MKKILIVLCVSLLLAASTAWAAPQGHWHWAQDVLEAFESKGLLSAGAYNPDAPASRGLVAHLLYGWVQPTRGGIEITFPDANEEILVLASRGWLAGYPDGCFHPEWTITRAEITAILVRVSRGGTSIGEWDAPFPDVRSHWARNPIGWARSQDLVKGYPDGTFRPENQVTVAEAVSLIYRFSSKFHLERAGVESLPSTVGGPAVEPPPSGGNPAVEPPPYGVGNPAVEPPPSGGTPAVEPPPSGGNSAVESPPSGGNPTVEPPPSGGNFAVEPPPYMLGGPAVEPPPRF